MDKRLIKLLLSGKVGGGSLYLLDTYNQAVYDDVACTITTRINASNQHYVIEKDMEMIERDTPMKGNHTEPRIRAMIYDDYNSKFSQDQDVIGTITTQIGNPAPRYGFKIVESAEPLRIPQATKQGFVEVMPGSLFDMSYPESKTRRGRVQDGGRVSPTLMASGEAPCHYEGKAEQSYRIRKLTPKECFRLMGVSEGDIEKIQNSGVSQSQQYKMAGNSIVVDVLEHIFRKMFVETEQEFQQLSLF